MLQRLVSIPAGFSDALRLVLWSQRVILLFLFQSLLGFLMRCDLESSGDMIEIRMMFQSLLGFLMRCDAGLTNYDNKIPAVSIPAGFSDALRPNIPPRISGLASLVSIPAGFSDALRLDWGI